MQAFKAELPHLQAASLRYKEVLKERNSLAAFLEGVAEGVECDTSFARCISHVSRKAQSAPAALCGAAAWTQRGEGVTCVLVCSRAVWA